MIYEIRSSTNLREIGKYPQITSADYKSPVMADNFIGNLYLTPLPSNVVAPNPIMEKTAKKTDLLNAPIMGYNLKLIVSKKLKSIIEKHSKEQIQYVPISVIHKEHIYENYYALHPVKAQMNVVDFPSSKITVTKKNKDGKIYDEVITVNSLEEFDGLANKSASGIIAHCITDPTINKEAVKDSFFALRKVFTMLTYYVTEELKNEIVNAGCTGIQFKEIRTTQV